ncbi:MAG: PRC-barrel domain-containing protein [Acetobacterales bacterium]
MQTITRSFCAAIMVTGLIPLADLHAQEGAMATGKLRATDIIGQSVKTQGGETVGDIEDLLISDTGQVSHAVVAGGGFLGLGEQRVTLPYEKVRGAGESIVLSEQEAKTLPVYEEKAFDATGRSGEQMAAAPTTADNAPFTDERSRLGEEYNEWSGKIGRQLEEGQAAAKDASADARDGLEETWVRVKEAWEDVKAASEENWEAAKTSFNDALHSLERQWNELDRQGG